MGWGTRGGARRGAARDGSDDGRDRDRDDRRGRDRDRDRTEAEDRDRDRERGRDRGRDRDRSPPPSRPSGIERSACGRIITADDKRIRKEEKEVGGDIGVYKCSYGVHTWDGVRPFEYDGEIQNSVAEHVEALPVSKLRAIWRSPDQLRQLLMPLLLAKYEQHADLAEELKEHGRGGCRNHPPVESGVEDFRYDPGEPMAKVMQRVATEVDPGRHAAPQAEGEGDDAAAPSKWGQRRKAHNRGAEEVKQKRDAVTAALAATGGAGAAAADGGGAAAKPVAGLPDVPDDIVVADLPDHWARLGVRRDADEAAIKRAFRRLAALLHPDRPSNQGDLKAEAVRRFQLVTEAYATLGDPTKRRKHMERVARGGRKRDADRSRSPGGVR